MEAKMRAIKGNDGDPWTWPAETWRGIVDPVRAGRSLKPSSWKGGASCAIALSFDSDHETIELRNGGKSFSRISQGQYGARAGVPRILNVLDRRAVPATFFMPAVSAMLHPGETRAVADAGHEIGLHNWVPEYKPRPGPDTPRGLPLKARERPARRTRPA